MDLWCAIWFWPADKIDLCPTPKTFYKSAEEIISVAKQVADQLRFFHWEIEFPDVFNPGRNGFDAIVGNPPWEISKPSSLEFFSNYDPIYRTYGRQEALKNQRYLFENNTSIESNWLIYNGYYRSMSNFIKYVSVPFGDSTGSIISFGRRNSNIQIHSSWNKLRNNYKGYASKEHPYRYQGSADLNTYKLFVEISYYLLNNKGSIGIIIPSGIYTDEGTRDLRNLFINESSWEWIWGFINWKKLFPSIYYRFKFSIIIVKKSHAANFINVGFSKKDFESWIEAEKEKMLYHFDQINKFSPANKMIFEVSTQEHLEVIDKIYSSSEYFNKNSSDSIHVQFQREFDTTNDSKLFPPLTTWLNDGFIQNDYGIWTNEENEIAIPMYEGRMVGQFNFSSKIWVSGRGRRAVWDELLIPTKIGPQYLISKNNLFQKRGDILKLRITYKAVASATNSRTFIGSLVKRAACLHSVPTLTISSNQNDYLYGLLAIMNSIPFDFVLRQIVGGIYINWSMIEEAPVLKLSSLKPINDFLKHKVIQLNFNSTLWSDEWIKEKNNLKHYNWYSLWAVTEHERLRIKCIIDAVLCEKYGLSYDDLYWILKDCDLDIQTLNEKYHELDPKGFWRVDKEKPKELRQTTLTLQAFKRLKEVGLDEFIKEDWQFPKEIQTQLGPRFLDWQLKGTPEESWAECEYHAKQILGEKGFKKFMEELESDEKKTGTLKEPPSKYGKEDDLRLF